MLTPTKLLMPKGRAKPARARHRSADPSATTAKLMVFKLVTAAAKTWRRLKGENQLPKIVQGVRFQSGIEVIEMLVHHAA